MGRTIMRLKTGELITGLDVGSTKVCVVVGEVKDGMVDIIGTGISNSRGIKKGVVVNIEEAVESIREAVEGAEMSTGVTIKAVYTGISGRHIKSDPSNGVIAVKEKEINQKEVDRVIDAARAVAIPFDREVLHVIPVGYTVNGENGISDPRGMGGVRLEVNVQIITGAATSMHNLIRSCQKAGLEVIDFVFEPLASAGAIISGDEKELGVAVVDIGGGTTDIALFKGGSICHASVLTIGGNNFTNDVAIGLRIPASESEKMKLRHGCSMISLVKEDEEIEIGYGNGRPCRKVPANYLIEIIQPRAEELFGLIRDEIRFSGGEDGITISGVVLTGGASMMKGMDVMAENIIELPVRIGSPEDIEGPAEIGRPEYAAGVGLVLYGAEGFLAEQRSGMNGGFNGIVSKMRGWVKESIRL
jgi:cell division protein FtsA